MPYQLRKDELDMYQSIVDKYYMKPVILKISEAIGEKGILQTFDYLHPIFLSTKESVDVLLEARKAKGEIKDVSQARKSVVGSMFSNCIVYLFLEAKKSGFVNTNIFVTNKTNDLRFKKMITILVDGETQKPDMDLLFYSENEELAIHKCMIMSLKTSLRERAGQTYKWKLLMEIALGESALKDKYNITYNPDQMPLVCFATINFYNEINNPQHKGMFKFFDESFIGKPIHSDFISNLSTIVKFANSKLL